MSHSSDETSSPNFQRARQLFENSQLHYYAKGGAAFGGSGGNAPGRPNSRPATTYILTQSDTHGDISPTISLPTTTFELPSPCIPSDQSAFAKVQCEQSDNGVGGIVARKNSSASLVSTSSSTSSQSTSVKSTLANLTKSLSKNIKKNKDKVLSVYDKNKNSNGADSVNINNNNNNNNNSDSDEIQPDKTRRESYKHNSVKENFLDVCETSCSTDTDDDTFLTDNQSAKKSLGKIHHILEELITTEEEYIKKLEFCIENYLKFVTNDHDLPVPLKGQQTLIFSEIENIHKFHKNLFYPALANCNYDLDKIIDQIRHFVRENYFYPYVMYAMNKPKSERVVKANESSFIERQNEIGDRLGLASYLMEPIQRLPKYKLLIYEMIKDYMKHYLNKNTTSTMESLCRAEKEMQRVLDAANESITLSDIVIDDYQINIHHQGKFIRSGQFEIHDPKLNKKYEGKLFLFTYCLIYTEYSASNKRKLIYRGYYDCKTFGVRQDCNETTNFDRKFYIFDSRPGHNEIEFVQCENNLENWYSLLQPIVLTGIMEGKSKNQMVSEPNTSSIMRNQTFRFLQARRDTTSGYGPTITINSNFFDHVRISNASTLSSGIGSNRSSRCSTASGHEMTEDTIFEKIVYSEKHYIHYLKTCSEVYLEGIEDVVIVHKLNKFCRSFEQILSYHQNVLYPKFLEHEMGYANLFALYEMYFESNIILAYMNYTVVAANACDILKTLYKNQNLKSVALPIEEFIKLPIYRNKYYLSTVDQYIKEYMRNDFRDRELLEHAAYLQSNFSKIHKQIDETFKLYSIKQNSIKLLPFGMCEYSDIVSLDIFRTLNHRICIMEYGLICIKFKTISEIQEEHYREIVFSQPYTIDLLLRDSIKHPNKLHFDTADQKSIMPSVTFQSAILKMQFSNLIGEKLEIKNDNHY